MYGANGHCHSDERIQPFFFLLSIQCLCLAFCVGFSFSVLVFVIIYSAEFEFLLLHKNRRKLLPLKWTGMARTFELIILFSAWKTISPFPNFQTLRSTLFASLAIKQCSFCPHHIQINVWLLQLSIFQWISRVASIVFH